MDPFQLERIAVDDGIELRRFGPNDAAIVFDTVDKNREHLIAFMDWMTDDYSIESAKEFLVRSAADAEKRKSLGFGIFSADEFVGSIGFVNFDWKAGRTEIGYWIAKNHEGKGIVSRCCKALIKIAFDELGVNRIEIRCSARNLRSATIPERLGFTKEATLRQSEFRNGELHDFLIFGLLRCEWKH